MTAAVHGLKPPPQTSMTVTWCCIGMAMACIMALCVMTRGESTEVRAKREAARAETRSEGPAPVARTDYTRVSTFAKLDAAACRQMLANAGGSRQTIAYGSSGKIVEVPAGASPATINEACSSTEHAVTLTTEQAGLRQNGTKTR